MINDINIKMIYYPIISLLIKRDETKEMFIGIFCTYKKFINGSDISIINTEICRTNEECIQSLWKKILREFVGDVNILLRYVYENKYSLGQNLYQKMYHVFEENDESSEDFEDFDEEDEKTDKKDKILLLEEIRLNFEELQTVLNVFFGEDQICHIKISSV